MSSRTFLSICIGSILLIASSTTATAEPSTRPYVTGTVGTSTTHDMEATFTGDMRVDTRGRITTKNGPDLTVGGGVGLTYSYTRMEVRADYHRDTIESVSPGMSPVGGNPVGQNMSVTTVLYTLALRYPFWNERFEIYGGGGLGAAYGKIPLGGVWIDDWEVGYAAIAGGYVEIWKGIGLDIGYRYVGAGQFSEQFPVFEEVGGKPVATPHNVTADWDAHELLFSLQYRFGAID